MERLSYNQHDYVSDSGDVLPYSQYDTTYQASFTPAPVETAPWHNADTPAHTGEGAAVRTMHTSETPYTDAQLLAAHDDTWR